VFSSALGSFDPERHTTHRQRPRGLAEKHYRGLETVPGCRHPDRARLHLRHQGEHRERRTRRHDATSPVLSMSSEVFLFDDSLPTGTPLGRNRVLLSDEDAPGTSSSVPRRPRRMPPRLRPRIIHQTMFSEHRLSLRGRGCPAGMVQVHLARQSGDVWSWICHALPFGIIRSSAEGIWVDDRARASTPTFGALPPVAARLLGQAGGTRSEC